MSSAKVLAFETELSSAIRIAAEKKAAYDAIPEISTTDILASFKRELRSVSVEGFGKVYFYHPMSIAERCELEEKIESGALSAAGMVHSVIALALNGDGSRKFSAEHFQALMDAPQAAIAVLANSLLQTHKISVPSVEKK